MARRASRAGTANSNRAAVHRIDVSDDRRTAESVLAIEAHEIRDVIAELAKVKRLSIVMRNLNRLTDSPADRELDRRALRHLFSTPTLMATVLADLAFSMTEPVLNRGHLFGSEAGQEHEMQSG
jgi:hypothetical protein